VRPKQSFASSLWLKVWVGFGLAFLVARYLPRGGGEETPGLDTLVSAAALIMLFTTGALYLGIRYNLRLPTRVAIYAVAYNALIVCVKFVLGPLGLYEVNRSVDLTSLFPVSDAIGALWTGTLVFGLYVLGYWLVYRLACSAFRPPIRPSSGGAAGESCFRSSVLPTPWWERSASSPSWARWRGRAGERSTNTWTSSSPRASRS
jgi:hypothetical protein